MKPLQCWVSLNIEILPQALVFSAYTNVLQQDTLTTLDFFQHNNSIGNTSFQQHQNTIADIQFSSSFYYILIKSHAIFDWLLHQKLACNIFDFSLNIQTRLSKDSAKTDSLVHRLCYFMSRNLKLYETGDVN